jgi:hypothetical protein
MLGTGDLFYVVTNLGDPAFARSYRCWCGFETIRTTPGDDTDDGLAHLPLTDASTAATAASGS